MHKDDEDKWLSEATALYYFLNYGFRFAPPEPSEMKVTWQVGSLYLVFMIIVQLVLLNLLVAIMSGTLSRLRGSERLMARHVRARLVLNLEHQVISRIQVTSPSRSYFTFSLHSPTLRAELVDLPLIHR